LTACNFVSGDEQYRADQIRRGGVHQWVPKAKISCKGGGRNVTKVMVFRIRCLSAEQSENCDRYTAVDDLLIAADTWTIMLGEKEISLGPVVWTLFSMLVRKRGAGGFARSAD